MTVVLFVVGLVLAYEAGAAAARAKTAAQLEAALGTLDRIQAMCEDDDSTLAEFFEVMRLMA